MQETHSNKQISLTVRDLLLPKEVSGNYGIPFPASQRGQIGKNLQTQLQVNQSGIFREYGVSLDLIYRDYKIRITGKIDGMYKKPRHWLVEEIKSVILPVSVFRSLGPEETRNYTEQLLFYCLMLYKTDTVQRINPVLRLGNLVNDQVRSFNLEFDPRQTEQLLHERLDLVIDFLEKTGALTEKRRRVMNTFTYPLREQRPQQKKMIEEISRVLSAGEHILISAPTGSGKTVAAVYPALKHALTSAKKVYFATSKNTQQRIVSETLKPFTQKDLGLQALFLRAARKMCLNHTYFCHDRYCPFADGMEDRLKEAGLHKNLHQNEIIEPEFLIRIGQEYTLCPSELMIRLSRDADFICGDYNYVFEPSSFLRHFLMGEQTDDWILIIDEAHNLYERAIGYLSPQINRSTIKSILKEIGKPANKVNSDLKRSVSGLKKILDNLHLEGQSFYSEQSYFIVTPDKEQIRTQFEQFEHSFIRYLIHKIQTNRISPDDPLQDFYYELRRFVYVLDRADDRFQIIYRADSGGILKIQCCDPSEYLGRIINSFHSVIAMSATIEPMEYYRSVLGFPDERCQTLSLDSPFLNKNRKIIVVPQLSTRYRHRTAAYPHYAEIIRKSIRHRPGNYIAFFPGFEFLQQVYFFLGDCAAELMIQRPEMNEDQRRELLERFGNSEPSHLLLAVMGGIFAESIDLKGEDCIGVMIFSPALPNISVERELIREYFDRRSENGFDYAYVYPGMNKVIQAAGRLIRSATDRGIIVIVGERFAEDSYSRLFPDYWYKNPGDVVFTSDFEKEIKTFWEESDS